MNWIHIDDNFTRVSCSGFFCRKKTWRLTMSSLFTLFELVLLGGCWRVQWGFLCAYQWWQIVFMFIMTIMYVSYLPACWATFSYLVIYLLSSTVRAKLWDQSAGKYISYRNFLRYCQATSNLHLANNPFKLAHHCLSDFDHSFTALLFLEIRTEWLCHTYKN